MSNKTISERIEKISDTMESLNKKMDILISELKQLNNHIDTKNFNILKYSSGINNK